MSDAPAEGSAAALPPENAYGHTKKLRFILESLDQLRTERQASLRVMDFGCGNGTAVTQFLAASDIELHGVDVHPPSLKHAQATFGGPGVSFHDAVPPGLRFDAVVYADVLEHLKDPGAILRDHVERLSPGGMVIGAVPNGYGPFEMEHRLNRILPLQRLISGAAGLRRRLQGNAARHGEVVALDEAPLPYNHDSGHVVFFTRQRLKQLLQAAGLKLTRFSHGSLFCGPISTPLIRGRLTETNVRLAEALPSWTVSTWYFTARLPRE